MAFYIDTCLTELHCILSVSRRGATVSIIINSGFLWLFIYAKENEMPQLYLQSTLVFSLVCFQLNKQQLQVVKERFQAFMKGETQIVADEAFCNAVRSYYEARLSDFHFYFK